MGYEIDYMGLEIDLIEEIKMNVSAVNALQKLSKL
jgi:hypothetical protein